MYQFLSGILTMGYAVAGMFFWKYWSISRDRLFAGFSLAFSVLALQQLALIIMNPRHIMGLREYDAAFYMLRLAAFVIILIAIVDKNRPRK